jgi:nucleotide-binding universal stress UspA family protein
MMSHLRAPTARRQPVTTRQAETTGRPRPGGPEIRRVRWSCDFSTASGRALDQAVSWAGLFGAEITALHVIAATLPPSGGLFSIPNPALLDPRLKGTLRRDLERFLEPARSAHMPASLDLRVGEPAEEICRLAAELPADLVVMGAGGRRPLERWRLGSATERVLRSAPCPVLVVPGRAAARSRAANIILCATDFSELGAEGLRYAAAFARAGRARLLLLHVLEDAPTGGRDKETWPVAWAPLAAEARHRLQKDLDRERGTGGPGQAIVAAGRPDTEIVLRAREAGARLIVLGAWGGGRTALRPFGFTARRVAEAARCPVLVIRRE